ncbi:MAG: DTW domain-containing protein [Algicola sp.]|nr:DTW domain-containing protein [Algicola sp.]
MKQKRSYCQTCHFPQVTCLCHVVKPVVTKHQIIILQHPSETTHAKGSARLVGLCMKEVRIVVGETAEDFSQLREDLKTQGRPVYLVYPTKYYQAIESMGKQHQPLTLILLDASWKKAYKLLMLNPWLSDLPCIGFDQSPLSQYQIRKSSKSYSLSTLESVVYCLNNLDDTSNTAPLMNVFETMIDNQMRFMSDAVKKRY